MLNKPTKKRDRLDVPSIGELAGYKETNATIKVKQEAKPYTLKECFDILDKVFSPEEKQRIIDTLDPLEFHFSEVGLFIRNKFVHGNLVLQKNINEKLQKSDYISAHPDNLGEYILTKYKSHLKN